MCVTELGKRDGLDRTGCWNMEKAGNVAALVNWSEHVRCRCENATRPIREELNLTTLFYFQTIAIVSMNRSLYRERPQHPSVTFLSFSHRECPMSKGWLWLKISA